MKKGFTLVELLAVIIVLGIIATISFPLITNQINKSKQKSYDGQVKTIIDAAKRWGFDNDDSLPYDDTSKTISIDRIQKDGYLTSGNILDPRTEKKMNGCIQIKYDVNYKQHIYQYITECSITDIS